MNGWLVVPLLVSTLGMPAATIAAPPKAREGRGRGSAALRLIWPMSLIVRALTTDDDAEIAACLKTLTSTDAGRGFIHEAFDQDDPTVFTRPWFAWANTLFGELIIDLSRRKPKLLRSALS